MRCSKCSKDSVIRLSYFDKHYCKKCFSEMIEKRVRRYLRINNLLGKKETLLVKDSASEHFLRKIIKNPNIQIVKKKTKEVTKEVLPWTMDDELNLYLKCIFTACSPKIQDKKMVKLFLPVPETELDFFCKQHKINFKPMKKEPFFEGISKLEKKHPDIKFNLLKSFQHLK